MRQAFSMLVGSDVISNKLPEGYSVATSLFPDGINGEHSAEGITKYNKDEGKKLYLKELEKLPDKKFPADTLLYYYDNGSIKPVTNDIVDIGRVISHHLLILRRLPKQSFYYPN